MKRVTAIAASIIITILTGCGREYHLQGRVVAAEVMSVTGKITEITGNRMPEKGTPVQGAAVTIFFELKKDGSPVEESTWKRSFLTDGQGAFDIRDYSIPAKKTLVGIRITKPGFDPLYTTYWDYYDIEPQVFFAEMKPSI